MKNLIIKKIVFVVVVLFCYISYSQIPKGTGITEKENKEIEKKLQGFNVPKNIATLKFSSEKNNVQPSNLTINDADQDGLSDEIEVSIGTDPFNPDTDGDALLDNWEVAIVDGIDLKSYGGSPLHKDIYVEMDYMVRANATYGLKPNDYVLNQIAESFAKSPVENPDGMPGIKIHLIMGEEVAYDNDLNPLIPQFSNLKRKYFLPNRSKVFHYMIWADCYNGTTSSGYSLDMPGSDFVVTLGAWNNRKGGTDEQKIGTFIHELGHNLGLHHGGNDDSNYKPNHLSIMNYFFQMSGVPKSNGTNIVFDYSYQPFVLQSLDEMNINESLGISTNSNVANYFTRYVNDAENRIFQVKASSPIDWNSNNLADEVYYINLNGDTQLNVLQSTPNEWLQLFFNGGKIGSRDTLAGIIEKTISSYSIMPSIELTEQMFQKIASYENK